MFALVVALAAGVVAGVVAGIGAGVGLGLAVGLMGVLVLGLVGVPGNLATAASPRAVLARDRQVALLFRLVPAVVVGVVAGFAVGVAVGLAVGLAAGLAVGLVVGVGGALMGARAMGPGGAESKRRGRHTCSPEGGWRCATGCRGRL